MQGPPVAHSQKKFSNSKRASKLCV
jgi:hypothetical protein